MLSTALLALLIPLAGQLEYRDNLVFNETDDWFPFEFPPDDTNLDSIDLIYMDLLDYRMFRTADGVTEGDQFTHNWDGSMKGASVFDPRMIELQKDYATKLLTHRNPYTGLRYVDDPDIAIVETTNENSIFYFFRNAELSRPYYREALARRWNRWLGDSRRVLITAVGRAENTAQGFVPPTPQQRKWTATAWMLPAEGRLPVITEPIRAALRLNVPRDAKVYALDATGARREQLQCVNDSGSVRVRLDDARSIWCEVVVP